MRIQGFLTHLFLGLLATLLEVTLRLARRTPTCPLIPRGHTLSWSWWSSYNDLLKSLWSDMNAQCVFLNPRILWNCISSERYKDFNTRIHCVCLKKKPFLPNTFLSFSLSLPVFNFFLSVPLPSLSSFISLFLSHIMYGPLVWFVPP